MKNKLFTLFITILCLPLIANAASSKTYTVTSPSSRTSTYVSWATKSSSGKGAYKNTATFTDITYSAKDSQTGESLTAYCLDPHQSWGSSGQTYTVDSNLNNAIGAGYAAIIAAGTENEVTQMAIRIYAWGLGQSRSVSSASSGRKYQMTQIINFALNNASIKNAGKTAGNGTYSSKYTTTTSTYSDAANTRTLNVIDTSFVNRVASLIVTGLKAADNFDSSGTGTLEFGTANGSYTNGTATANFTLKGTASKVTCTSNEGTTVSPTITNLTINGTQTVTVTKALTQGESTTIKLTCTFEGASNVALLKSKTNPSSRQRFIVVTTGDGSIDKSVQIKSKTEQEEKDEEPGSCDPNSKNDTSSSFSCTNLKNILNGECNTDSKYNEGYDETTGKFNFEKCMGEDWAGNSLENTTAENNSGIGDNPYCDIYCREEYYFKYPSKQVAKAGTYFSIDGIAIYSDDTNQTGRTCYLNSKATKFKNKITSLNDEYEGYVKLIKQYRDEISSNNTQIGILNYRIASADENTDTTALSNQIRTLTDRNTELNDTLIPQAKKDAYDTSQEIEKQYNYYLKCSEISEIDFEFEIDPELTYTYNEPQSATSTNKWITEVEKNGLNVMVKENSNVVASKGTATTYKSDEFEGKTDNIGETRENISMYLGCTEADPEACVATDKDVKHNYLSQSSTLASGTEISYKSQRVYYNHHVNGDIIISDNVPSSSEGTYDQVNGLPIAFDTPSGVYYYSIKINGLGYFSDESADQGRIYSDTQATSISTTLDNQCSSSQPTIENADGTDKTVSFNEYACTYEVNDGSYCIINNNSYYVCPSDEYSSDCVGPYDQGEAIANSDITTGCNSFCYHDATGYWGCTGSYPDDVPEIPSATCKHLEEYEAGCYTDGNCNTKVCKTYTYAEPFTIKTTDNDSEYGYKLNFRTISKYDVIPNSGSDVSVGYNWDTTGLNARLVAAKAAKTIEEIETNASNTDIEVDETDGLTKYTDASGTAVTNFKIKVDKDLVDYIKETYKNISYDTSDTIACQSVLADTVDTKKECESEEYSSAGYKWEESDPETGEGQCIMPNIFCYSSFIDDLLSNDKYKDDISISGDRQDDAYKNAKENPTISSSKLSYVEESENYNIMGANLSNGNYYWKIFYNVNLNTQHAGPSWK